MWMNVGRSQFHLPTGKPQVLRGKTGIVIEGREALLKRLATVKPKLADTKFDFTEHNDYVQATCPWGNTIRLHEPDAARFGRITLGIPYVEFDVPVGTAKGIAKFYRADDRRAGRGRERRRHHGEGHGRQEPVPAVPRDRQAAAGLRRAPRPDLRRRTSPARTSGSASAASSTARTTSTSTASATSPISTPASTCSPSSTRCAASRTRCSCGRWSTAIRRRPRATIRNGYDQNSWAMEPQHFDDQQHARAQMQQQ